MYNEYFGLKEAPFSIAPDPRYLYMSQQHREALAHLIYGIGSDGGFILLTGEVGAGKTTVCRCLLEQMPENTNVALVLNPKVVATELLATICDELHIPYPEGSTSIKTFVDRINTYLLEANAAGKKTVVIIDESQNLDSNVLEQLRLLTNLETNQRKLMQIIMLGQPELQQILESPEMEQLNQRITARFHLNALNKNEVADYIKHRLAVAGLRADLFSKQAVKLIYKLTGGVPRRINVLCDRALLGVYVQNSNHVDKKTIRKAAHEVFGSRPGFFAQPGLGWLALAMVLLLLGMGGVYYYQHSSTPDVPVAQPGASDATLPQEGEDKSSSALVDKVGWMEDAGRGMAGLQVVQTTKARC